MRPQIIIYLQDGQIHAEAPAANGSRRKIDLQGLPPVIRIELEAQAREAQAQVERQQQLQQAAQTLMSERTAAEVRRLRKDHALQQKAGFTMLPQAKLSELRKYVTATHPLTAARTGLYVHARPLKKGSRRIRPQDIGV